MSDTYGNLTCNRLKEELSRRGAKTTGTKSALVERLRAYDRNQDFSTSSNVILPESLPMPEWPDSVVFRTLTLDQSEDLPPIKKEHLQQYVVYRQGCDHQSVSDIKAISKGKLVAEESVEALSLHKQSELTFFTGRVNASMKKRISYSVKIILQETGEVRNSHCECPSGMGPHGTCKHVVAILMVIINFKETGKISISKSCTETLQSFHKPKRLHTGSPKKAENLGNGIPDDVDDDPRPQKYRNRPGNILVEILRSFQICNANFFDN